MDLRNFLIAFILLSVTTVASAVPVLAFLATNITIGGVVVATYGSVLFMAGSILFGSAQQRKLKKRALREQQRQKNDFNAGLSDRTVNGIGSEFPSRHVYGTARIGGNIVDIITSGDRDQFQHVIALATQHEIDDFPEIYLNGKAVGVLDNDGFATQLPFGKSENKLQTVLISTSSYTLPSDAVLSSIILTREGYEGNIEPAPYSLNGFILTPAFAGSTLTFLKPVVVSTIRITKHLGLPGGSYDVRTHNDTDGKLKTTSVFNGHSYIAIRLDLDEPEFQNLPSIEMLVKREKAFDVRTGAISDFAGTNPALVAYNYLTSDLCNLESISLPVSKYITAANDCDEIVDNGDGNRRRYTFNGMISSDQSREEVLQFIADSMAGGIVATTWDIFAGVYRAPIMSLDESDIVGSLSVTPGVSELEVFNVVYGRYASSDNAWLEKDYRKYTQNAYISIDGGEKEVGITYPFTISQTEVDQLNRIAIEQTRNAFTISAMFSLKAWKLKVGDRILWNSSFMGQTQEVYKVVDRSSGESAGVTLVLKKDSPFIYDLGDSFIPETAPPTSLPNPWIIDPPLNLALESGTNALILSGNGSVVIGIKVSYVNKPEYSSDSFVTDIEAYGATGGAVGNDLFTTAQARLISATLNPAQEGQVYRVRVRTRNLYTGAKSTWVYAAPHTVIGKTEPPPDVTGFSIAGNVLSWNNIERDVIPDISGFLVRFNYGNSLDWELATPLHTGILTSSPYELQNKPSGSVTIVIKAKDTSGNESLNAAYIFTELGDPVISNVLEIIDFDAQGYPGNIIGGSISAGNIVANTTTAFWSSDPLSPFWSNSPFNSFWSLSAYQSLTYTTESVEISSALIGSVATLVLVGQGEGLSIEYRVLGRSPFWPSTLLDSFWPNTSLDSFWSESEAFQPWPGQIPITNGLYQFRVNYSSGSVQPIIEELRLVIDAPDIIETIDNLPISISGTTVVPTKNFVEIKNISFSLQAGLSGAVGVKFDKTNPAAPIATAINGTGAPVSGASIDITLKGY